MLENSLFTMIPIYHFSKLKVMVATIYLLHQFIGDKKGYLIVIT